MKSMPRKDTAKDFLWKVKAKTLNLSSKLTSLKLLPSAIVSEKKLRGSKLSAARKKKMALSNTKTTLTIPRSTNMSKTDDKRSNSWMTKKNTSI